MSEVKCAVCGRVLEPDEIRLNKRSFRVGRRRSRYLCRDCRQKEYDSYTNSIKKLIEEKS